MGIKRNDLANGRPVCIDCKGVGRVLLEQVQTCDNCKGRGWVLEGNKS